MSAQLRDERGQSIVEVLVGLAIAVVAVGLTSVLMLSGTAASKGSQREVQVLGLAQRQIDEVRGLARQYGFASLSLTSAPPATGAAAATVPRTPSDPESLVLGSAAAPGLFTALDPTDTSAGQLAGTPATGESLVVGSQTDVSGATVAPRVDHLQTGVTSGDLTATVYRYVTDVPGTCTSGAACRDARRVTVAVVPARVAGDSLSRKLPVWLSAVITAPVPTTQLQGARGLSLSLGLQVGP